MHASIDGRLKQFQRNDMDEKSGFMMNAIIHTRLWNPKYYGNSVWNCVSTRKVQTRRKGVSERKLKQLSQTAMSKNFLAEEKKSILSA